MTIRDGFLLKNLDRRDSAILKGLAIFAIVLHNFFHLVSPARENEFYFHPTGFSVFLTRAIHPSFTIQAFFSFFGHYGVQIFVFLSAYGLAKSYWNDPGSWSVFVWGRIKKLYPIFGLVVIPWCVLYCLALGPVDFLNHSGLELLLMALGISTVVGFGLPPVGPWWFIPFIVQFYALWPFMRKLTIQFGWRGLLVLALACRIFTYFADPIIGRWDLDLLLTPIGHMSELCLGVAAARYNLRINGPLALLGCAVLLLGSAFQEIWLFTFLAALLVALWVYSVFRDKLRNVRLLQKLGEYSLLIFLLNGIVRGVFLSRTIGPGPLLLRGATSAVVSILLAAIIHEWLIPKPGVEAGQLQTN